MEKAGRTPTLPAFDLKRKVYGLAIAWDELGGKGVDLDLQAVIVDNNGVIVDAVYYNNTSAIDSAIQLSGDALTGDAEGYDEMITWNLNKFPPSIQLVIFVVAVYDRGHLRDVANGKITLLEEGMCVRTYDIERSFGDADMIALMRRKKKDPNSWECAEIQQPADLGSHFLDILEPNIGNVIRENIRHAPKFQKVAFQMEKGAVASLPSASKVRRLCVAIGGSLPPGSRVMVDIDISAVFYNKDGHVIGAVDCNTSAMYGVEHSGDRNMGENRSTRDIIGEGSGDDEAISIDVGQVPRRVARIFLVLTVCDGDFTKVRSAYTRIVDQSANELVRYEIEGGRRETGLIVGQLLRAKGKRWSFQAIGQFLTTKCNTWKGAKPEMARIFKESAAHQAEIDPTASMMSDSVLTPSEIVGDASIKRPLLSRGRSTIMRPVIDEDLLLDGIDEEEQMEQSMEDRNTSKSSAKRASLRASPSLKRGQSKISNGTLRLSFDDLGIADETSENSDSGKRAGILADDTDAVPYGERAPEEQRPGVPCMSSLLSCWST